MASTLIQGFDFGAMERELQGRQKVVVSKGTLAKVSREHTQMLKSLMMDVALNKAALAKIKDDWAIVDDLQQRVTSLEGQLAEAQETIRQQQETLDKQAEILEYGKRMEVIQQDLDRINFENETRDTKANEQRADHDALAERVNTESADTKKFRDGLQDGRTSISSQAVCVESERAQLSEVMHSRKSTLKRLEESMFECKESLDRKGDQDELEICQEQISDARRMVVNVKACLKAVGIDVDGGEGEGAPGGVFVEMANNIKQQKRQLDDTTASCRQLQASLLDKADVRHVDEKIERKYQEVVDHLQKAISAAADDEVEFKRVAMELQDTVKQLMNSKADSQALLEMKEQILNDSRLLDQLAEMRGNLDTKMDRTEAVEMIAQKPDKAEMMGDVRKTVSHMISKANFDSGPDAGWATRTSTPSLRSRPTTGDGVRGNTSLQCISCNSQVNKPTIADRPSTSPAVSQAAYARNAVSQGRDAGAPRYGPTMGPGGPALGGGFQVRLPDHRNSRAPARHLPKLQTRSSTGASRIIIGANGIVYQAADAAYPAHPHPHPQHAYAAGPGAGPGVHTAPPAYAGGGGATMAGNAGVALRHAQSLSPHAFPDNMPGTSQEEATAMHGAGPETVEETVPSSGESRVHRDPRYIAPTTDGGGVPGGTAGTSLVKPVSVRTHEPSF